MSTLRKPTSSKRKISSNRKQKHSAQKIQRDTKRKSPSRYQNNEDNDHQPNDSFFKDHSLLRLLRDYTGLRIDRDILPIAADVAYDFTVEFAQELAKFHKDKIKDKKRSQSQDDYKTINRFVVYKFVKEFYPDLIDQLETEDDLLKSESHLQKLKPSEKFYFQRKPIDDLVRPIMREFYDTKKDTNGKDIVDGFRLSVEGIDAIRHVIEVNLKFWSKRLSVDARRTKHKTLSSKKFVQQEEDEVESKRLIKYTTIPKLSPQKFSQTKKKLDQFYESESKKRLSKLDEETSKTQIGKYIKIFAIVSFFLFNK